MGIKFYSKLNFWKSSHFCSNLCVHIYITAVHAINVCHSIRMCIFPNKPQKKSHNFFTVLLKQLVKLKSKMTEGMTSMSINKMVLKYWVKWKQKEVSRSLLRSFQCQLKLAQTYKADQVKFMKRYLSDSINDQLHICLDWTSHSVIILFPEICQTLLSHLINLRITWKL